MAPPSCSAWLLPGLKIVIRYSGNPIGDSNSGGSKVLPIFYRQNSQLALPTIESPCFRWRSCHTFLKANRQLKQRAGIKGNRYLRSKSRLLALPQVGQQRKSLLLLFGCDPPALYGRWIGPLATARTMITAIETKTACRFDLRVKGQCAARESHAVTPRMRNNPNMKLFLLGSQYRPR
jgi:hypothetical protein